MPLSVEEARKLRQQYAGEIEALKAREKGAQSEDLREMLMLERRIISEHFECDLGNGDKIRLWNCLSEEEMMLFADLHSELVNKDNPPTEERRQEIIYMIIELLTVNPNITAEWLKEHPAKFSMHDALVIYFTGLRMVGERAAEVARIQNFRPVKTGKSVC